MSRQAGSLVRGYYCRAGNPGKGRLRVARYLLREAQNVKLAWRHAG